MTPSLPPSARQRLLAADHFYSGQLRHAEKTGPLRRLAIFLAHSGDSWLWGLGLALAWRFGAPAWAALAPRLLLAIAVLAVLIFLIKRLFRRQRPQGEWGGIYRATDPHSFPSGHAARMALLLALTAAWGPAWLAWLLVIWAPLVALARVAMGVHYLSDVIGGAVVGLAVALPLIYALALT
ncbi:MAG: phosphatase PAP2 family protein [Anaerolineales bacterium]|nr:phosphatase PAP2 family protein [Anaerolineales bacterium]